MTAINRATPQNLVNTLNRLDQGSGTTTLQRKRLTQKPLLPSIGPRSGSALSHAPSRS
jgi:hypothetical protein